MNSKRLYKTFILSIVGVFSLITLLYCGRCNNPNNPTGSSKVSSQNGNLNSQNPTNGGSAPGIDNSTTANTQNHTRNSTPAGAQNNSATNSPSANPADISEIKGGGLPNIGNTCYMNSILQACIRLNLLSNKKKTPMANAYWAIENELNAGNPVSNSMVETFYKEILARVPGFRRGAQEDAHDLLAHLLDRNDVAGITDIGASDGIPFKMETEFICKNNHKRNNPAEDNNVLHIPIIAGKSMQELITTEMELKEVVAIKCYSCAEANTTKALKFASIPDKLIVQLIRFNVEPDGTINKVTDAVPNVESLILKKEWLSAGLPATDIKYDLVGVIVHSGSYGGGHYFSYIKEPATNKWIEYNDSKVSELSNLKNREIGYIFIYNRRN